MAKTKDSSAPCGCQCCAKVDALIGLMSTQNQLMTKIMDQNSSLLDVIMSEDADDKEPDHYRSLD